MKTPHKKVEPNPKKLFSHRMAEVTEGADSIYYDKELERCTVIPKDAVIIYYSCFQDILATPTSLEKKYMY